MIKYFIKVKVKRRRTILNRILIVEDDAVITSKLTEFLKNEGFAVTAAACRKKALEALENEPFDLALLDITLPDGTGYAVCAAAKEIQKNIPVIFLTASDDEYSVVTGLDMGADDYISKPFRPRELVSRIKTVLRRNGKTGTVTETCGLRIDTASGIVTKNGKELFLSALEYKILLIFAGNAGLSLTRERLLDEIWDMSGEYVNDNTLTVYIKRLREKTEDDPQNPQIIRTVRGIGYKFGE